MWSLGALAMELFLGLPLFPGTSKFHLLHRMVATLGMLMVETPLACIGDGSYTSRLLFFFFASLLVILFIFLVELVRNRDVPAHTPSSRASLLSLRSSGSAPSEFSWIGSRVSISAHIAASGGNFVGRCVAACLNATPQVTTWLFVVYPMVTTVAFEAFPCHDFGDEGR
jgi:hypothetical protein